MTRLLRSSKFWLLNRALLVAVSLTIAGTAFAQTTTPSKNRTAAGGSAAGGEEATFLDYRGIKLGALADEVRKKLGSPANKGDEQDFYMFGETERAQVLYDKATNKVTAISVDFMSGARDVLTPLQVFGSDIETKPDGSKYKLVRYPKAGYWISYNRTAGDNPVVSVTIQKLP